MYFLCALLLSCVVKRLNISRQFINPEGVLPYHEYKDQYFVAEAIRDDEKPSTMPSERRGVILSATWSLLEESWDLNWENRLSAEEFRNRLQEAAHQLNL
jgi:hypothetical protein